MLYVLFILKNETFFSRILSSSTFLSRWWRSRWKNITSAWWERVMNMIYFILHFYNYFGHFYKHQKILSSYWLIMQFLHFRTIYRSQTKIRKWLIKWWIITFMQVLDWQICSSKFGISCRLDGWPRGPRFQICRSTDHILQLSIGIDIEVRASCKL